METIYFQPPGIRPQYCEIGMIHESDPEYIWYLNEPCKILISEVKIIPKKDVEYDKKSRLYRFGSLAKLPSTKHKLLTKPFNGNFAKLLVICSGGYKH